MAKSPDIKNFKEARDLSSEIGENITAWEGGYKKISDSQSKVLDAGKQMLDVTMEMNDESIQGTETMNRRVKLIADITSGTQDLTSLEGVREGIADQIAKAIAMGNWYLEDQLKAELALVDIEVGRVGAIDAATKAQENFTKEIEEASTELQNGLVGGLGEFGSMLDSFASKGLLVGGIAAGVGMLTMYSGILDDVGDKYGAIGSTQFSEGLIDANIQAGKLGMSSEDVQASISSLSSDFGMAFGDATELSNAVLEMSKGLGVGGAEGAKLVGTLSLMSGMSAETAVNTSKQVALLAAANGVAPVDVMSDIADSGEDFAKFGKDGGKNMLRAAIGAKKLGLNLKSVSGMMSGLLDFENSLVAEQEASLMLGRDVNLQKARELALNNDIEGAMREVVSQVGGEAEWNEMNALQRQALADSVGVGVEEMNKMVKNQDKLDLAGNLNDQDAAALNANDTLSEQTKIMNEMKEIMRDLSQDLGPALGDVMRGAAEASKTIVPVLAEIFKWISTGLTWLNNTIGLDNIMKALLGIWVISKAIAIQTWMKTWSASLGGVASKLMGTSKSLATFEKASKGGGKGMGGFTKSLNPAKMMQGAAALLMLAGALWISAKAFQEFSKVEWGAMAKAGVALIGLSGVVALLGMMSGPILVGAGAVLMLSAALMFAAVGFILFASVTWSGFFAGIGAILALAAVAGLLSLVAPFIIVGAAAMLILALPLVMLAGALMVFSMVDMATVQSNMGMLGGALGEMPFWAFIKLGVVSPFMLLFGIGLIALSGGLAALSAVPFEGLSGKFEELGDALGEFPFWTWFALLPVIPIMGLFGIGLIALAAGIAVISNAGLTGLSGKFTELGGALDAISWSDMFVFGLISPLIAALGIGFISLGLGLVSLDKADVSGLSGKMTELAAAMDEMDPSQFVIFGYIGGLIAMFGFGLVHLGKGLQSMGEVGELSNLAYNMEQLAIAMTKMDVKAFFTLGLIGGLIAKFGDALTPLAKGVSDFESVDANGLADKFTEMNEAMSQIDVSDWFWVGIISPQISAFGGALGALAPGVAAMESVDVVGLSDKFLEMNNSFSQIDISQWYWIGEISPQMIILSGALYPLADAMNYVNQVDMEGLAVKFMEMGYGLDALPVGQIYMLGESAPQLIALGNAMYEFADGMNYVAKTDMAGIGRNFLELGFAFKQIDLGHFLILGMLSPLFVQFGRAMIPFGTGMQYVANVDLEGVIYQFSALSLAMKQLDPKSFTKLVESSGKLGSFGESLLPLAQGVDAMGDLDVNAMVGQFARMSDAFEALGSRKMAMLQVAGIFMGSLSDMAQTFPQIVRGVESFSKVDLSQIGGQFKKFNDALDELPGGAKAWWAGMKMGFLSSFADTMYKLGSGVTAIMSADFNQLGPKFQELGDNLTAAETLKPGLANMEGLDFTTLVKLSDQLNQFVQNSVSFINMKPEQFQNIGPNIKALIEGFNDINPESGMALVKVSQIAWGNIATMTKHFGKIGTNMAAFSSAPMGDLGKNATSFVEFAQTMNEGGLTEMGNFSNLSAMAEAFNLISTALSEVSTNAETALPKLKELLGITSGEGSESGGGNPVVTAIQALRTDMVLAKDELVTLNTKFEGAFGTAGTIPSRIGGKVGEAIEGGI